MSTVADEAPVLQVEGLRVELLSGTDVVDDVSFDVRAGEVLGLVGESASGKTTVGLALLGHCRRGGRIAGGRVRISGQDVLGRPPAALRSLRGRVVSYVPQDPSAALNPALRIGRQLEETLAAHGFGDSAQARRERLAEMLQEVLLPGDREFLRRYPHQLSGGQQQRVGLAMAFACRPRVIVLDEPTTGLDVTTQAHVLETVRSLCRLHGVAALYISHDLAVVASLADRVAVMYAGRLVELGPQEQLFHAAAHPYTRMLVQTIPDAAGRYALVGIPGRAPVPGARPDGCTFAPRCGFAEDACRAAFPPPVQLSERHEACCFRTAAVLAAPLHERLAARSGDERGGVPALLSVRGLCASYGERQVVHDVSVEVRPHECVALVGESGSGKTTLGRCVAGLHRAWTGELLFDGAQLPAGSRARSGELRRAIQYVFQSPYSSLNPRKTVGQIVAQPLRLFADTGRGGTHRRVVEVLERVELSGRLAERYPDQLSGGERQRVAIARALAAEPRLLICDEVTSALDVSVQAAIVELLGRLQREMGLGLLFVTHNLALIRNIAQQVAVMSGGRIVEAGPVASVLDAPQAAYTRTLLADTPSLEPAAAPAG